MRTRRSLPHPAASMGRDTPSISGDAAHELSLPDTSIELRGLVTEEEEEGASDEKLGESGLPPLEEPRKEELREDVPEELREWARLLCPCIRVSTPRANGLTFGGAVPMMSGGDGGRPAAQARQRLPLRGLPHFAHLISPTRDAHPDQASAGGLHMWPRLATRRPPAVRRFARGGAGHFARIGRK